MKYSKARKVTPIFVSEKTVDISGYRGSQVHALREGKVYRDHTLLDLLLWQSTDALVDCHNTP